jgi:kynureninase
LDFALQIVDRVNAANRAVIDTRTQRKQLDTYAATAGPQIATEAKRISAELGAVEETLYQTKLRANEDALNFPIRLNNKLAALLGVVTQSDTAPTVQSYAVFKDLSAQLQVQLDKLEQIDGKEIAAFNTLVHDQNIPAITVRTKN